MMLTLLPLSTPLLSTQAHAGSEVVQELEGLHTPLVELEVGGEASSGDPVPDLLLAAGFRGVGGDDVGVHWGALTAASRLDPTDPAPNRLRGTLSIARWIGETYPVPVVWDVHLGHTEVIRDDRLGFAVDGKLTVADAMAGFYFPHVNPGDFDGHLVFEVGVGGAHRREYLDETLAPFSGAMLGAAGAEMSTGVALAHGVVLALHLNGRAEWSLGVSAVTAVVTDTTVQGGLTLRLGRHLALVVDGGAESTRDPGNDLAASYYRAAARIRVGE